MDNRIGIRTAEGVTAWPERTISGREYRRPCTTIGLDDRHFVVIDNFPAPGYMDEVERLRKATADIGASPKGDSMEAMAAPPKSASKVKVSDDSNA